MSLAANRLVPLVGLLGVWLALWGRVNVGLVVVGLALGVALAPPRDTPRRWTVRPWPLLRGLGGVAWAVIIANVDVAREVVTFRDDGPEAVVEVRLRRVGAGLDRLVALLVTLTPGTVALGLRREPEGPVMLVHVLKLDDPRTIIDDVHHLEDLVADALLPEGGPNERGLVTDGLAARRGEGGIA